MSRQILHVNCDANVVASSTVYGGIQGYQNPFSASDAIAYQVIPTAGTLDLLAFKATGSIGGTTTGTLYLNGSATALTVGVTNATAQHDSTHSVAVVAGDKVSFQIAVPAGATSRMYSYSIRFTPTIAGESILMGNTNNTAIVANDFLMLGGVGAGNASIGGSDIVIPETGTIKKLYVAVDTDPTVAASSITFTVFNNGAAGNNTCTIAVGSTTANDTTHTDSIASAGNTLCIKATVTGSPALSPVHYGLVYISPTQGNFIIPATTRSSLMSSTGTRFLPITGTRTVTTNEANLTNVSNAFTAKAIWCRLNLSPGAGKSYDFFLRKAAADTALTVNIADAAVAGNFATDVAIALDDMIDTSQVANATPAGRTLKITIIGYLNDNASNGNFFRMF